MKVTRTFRRLRLPKTSFRSEREKRNCSHTRLLEEQYIFQDLVSNLPVGIYRLRVRQVSLVSANEWEKVYRSDYQVEFASERFCEIAGLDRKAFLAVPSLILDRIHPDHRADFGERNAEAITQRIPFHWEGRLVDDGTPRWVRFESSPRLLRDGGTLWSGVLTDITERRKSSSDYRRVYSLLQQVGAIAKVGGWELDLEGGTLYWSDEVFRMLERDPRSRTPTLDNALPFYAPEWRPVITEALQRAISDGVNFDLDLEMITATGRRLWVHATSQVVLKDGRVVKVRGTYRDIATERLAADALAKSHAILAGILESSEGPIFALDRTYRYLRFNRAHAEAMKALYGSDISMGSCLFDYLSVPEDSATAKVHLDRAFAGESFTEEGVYGAETFNQSCFEVSYTPILVAGGDIIGVAVMARDTTERRRAQEALRMSEERNRALIRAIPDLLFTNTRDGEFLDIHVSDPNLLFLMPDSFVHRRVGEVLPEVIASPYLAAFQRALDDHAIQELEYTLPIGAKEKWFEARVVPCTEDTVITLVRDITQRKHLETEITNLNRGLERRVEIRTHQLELVNQELEAFAYSVSHDLRAPLRTISGFSEALERDAHSVLSPKGLEHLKRIQGGAMRMAQLIEDLLQLSQVGRDEFVMIPLDLGALAEEVLTKLSEADPERALTWQVDHPIPMTGDPRLLRILLENLLGNAWKFTSHTPDAHIWVSSDAADRTSVAMTIRDNGAGFHASQAGRLFTPFQRLHKADEFPGTGIGLAIAKRIINRHGGTIRAEGDLSHGAAITFTLPRMTESHP